MTYCLAELAERVGGLLAGNGQTVVAGANPLACAATSDITMIDSAEKVPQLIASAAVAAVVPLGLEVPLPAIQAGDVHTAFGQIVSLFRPPLTRLPAGVSPAAHVHPTAQLAAGVAIQPGAVIGAGVEIGRNAVIHCGVTILDGCRIGEDVTIFPGAVLYEHTVVGPRCILHAGCVLGAYGFGYKLVDGRHQPSGQLGYVLLEADVDVGACTTIDRGTYGPTIVGEGTKIDNHVMIAHNCRIGRHNMICSQVGIAGSTTTGDYVVMAGQVGVRDHAHIGHGAQLGAQSGVDNSVPDGAVMLGSPATPVREQWVIQSAIHKLPQMRREFRALQKQVEQLAQRIEAQRHAA